MFDNYDDVIDLVTAIKESRFDCSDYTSISIVTAYTGIIDLYPDTNETVVYQYLLEVLNKAIPEIARKISHDITVEKDTQVIYGDESSPVKIIINKFPDKTAMTIFVSYTTK